MNIVIDLIVFLTVLAAVAVFFGGLGYWFGKITAPRNGEANKLHAAIAKLREEVGEWRVKDRHDMRNELHSYVSPVLDKIDEDRTAMTQIRERLVTLEANSRRKS